MARAFDRLLEAHPLPHPLHEADHRLLLQLAEGNPGRLATFAALLDSPCFWRDGRVFAHSLASEALIMALRSFRERNAPLTDKTPDAQQGRGGRDD